MPIELNNQEINAALLEYDDGLFLAALVGTATADEDFPIATADKLHENLKRLHGLFEPEIDQHVLRPLLEWWSPNLVEFVLPINDRLDYSRKILLKVRSWKVVYDLDDFGDDANRGLFDPPEVVDRGYPRRR
jgi:hypothetical protein